MVYIDETVLYQIVQFLIIFFIGKKLIIDPVLKTVESRDSKIGGMKEEAEKLKQKVEDYRNSYEQKMADIKVELAEYHRKMKEEAVAEATNMVATAKEQIDAKIADARGQIAGDAKVAREGMDKTVAELSDLIINKIMLSS